MKLSDRLFAARASSRRASASRPCARDRRGVRTIVTATHTRDGPAVRPRRLRPGRAGTRRSLARRERPAMPAAVAGAATSSRPTPQDLTSDELSRLFTRDTPEAYRFFTRGIDQRGAAGAAVAPPLRPRWTQAFFMAFAHAPDAGAAPDLRRRAAVGGDRRLRRSSAASACIGVPIIARRSSAASACRRWPSRPARSGCSSASR